MRTWLANIYCIFHFFFKPGPHSLKLSTYPVMFDFTAFLEEHIGSMIAIAAIMCTYYCICHGFPCWRKSISQPRKNKTPEQNDGRTISAKQTAPVPNRVNDAKLTAENINKTYNLRILYGTQTGTSRRKLLYCGWLNKESSELHSIWVWRYTDTRTVSFGHAHVVESPFSFHSVIYEYGDVLRIVLFSQNLPRNCTRRLSHSVCGWTTG